jgi:anti-anti-sigma regulatory factor
MALDPGPLVGSWTDTVIDDIDMPADLSGRRRAAIAEANADAEIAHAGSRRPGAVGVRRYGPGCIALALHGRFDRGDCERLKSTARELERAAHTELAIDLAGLAGCDAALARAIARLRIRCLTRGARVELHDPPATLAAELGQHRP